MHRMVLSAVFSSFNPAICKLHAMNQADQTVRDGDFCDANAVYAVWQTHRRLKGEVDSSGMLLTNSL